MIAPENTQGEAGRRRIEELLQAYGRNPLRWPREDQARFAHLMRDPAGLPAEPAHEAAGLDRLLDLAGPSAVAEAPGARQRLVRRIAGSEQAAPPAGLMPRSLTGWQQLVAAAALAVAVMAGVSAGQSSETVAELAEFLGLQTDGGFAFDTVWLLDPGVGEDVL